MREFLLVAVFLAVMSSVATAESKIESKWHCDKSPNSKSFDVGDVAGHAYVLVQGTCKATTGSSGEESGTYTEFDEVWKANFAGRGRFIVTMNDGDKVYYSYETKPGSAEKSVAENWKIVGGTGKHKSDRGAGTCTGKLSDDGSSDWECSGSLATAK